MRSRVLFSLRLIMAALVWWMVLGTRPLAAEPCSKPASSLEFEAKLDQSRSRIFLVKFDDALRLLDEAEAMLYCLDAPIDRGILTRLYLYRGVAAFNKHNEAQTLRNFEYAVAIDRSTRWDDRFGQRPRELFIEAKEAALLAPKGRVRIPALREGVTLFLDGQERSSNALVPLAPGKHLLQIAADGRIVFGQLFDVVSDAEVQPPVPTSWLSSSPPPTSTAAADSAAGHESAAGSSVKPSEPREPFDRRKLRPISYVLLGLAGVTTSSALAGGFMTLSIQKDLRENYYSNRPDADKEALLSRQATTAAVANASMVAALITGGAGGVLFFMSRDDEMEPVGAIRPWLGREGGGLILSARF